MRKRAQNNSPGSGDKADLLPRKTSVLFICRHNAARSQMAEGYLRSEYGDFFTVASAGIEKSEVHPHTIAVMQERGVDLAGQRSKLLDEFTGTPFDIVVKVCDVSQAGCPLIRGTRETISAGFPDPTSSEGSVSEKITGFRQVRDAIISWIDDTFVPRFCMDRVRSRPAFPRDTDDEQYPPTA